LNNIVYGTFVAAPAKLNLKFHSASEGDMMRPISRSRPQGKHLESINALTFADTRMVEAFVMDCKRRRHSWSVKAGKMRGLVNDPLDGARGIFNGLRVSLVLWGLIGVAVILTR